MDEAVKELGKYWSKLARQQRAREQTIANVNARWDAKDHELRRALSPEAARLLDALDARKQGAGDDQPA